MSTYSTSNSGRGNGTQRQQIDQLPKSFKAAQFISKGSQLQINTIEMQPPRMREVLIQVFACGSSMYDKITQQDHMGRNEFPITPGQEMVGRVVMVGAGVSEWKMGDVLVAAWHGGSCFRCDPCRMGDFVCCEYREVNGITRNGGYAEYCILRSDACARVPHDMRLEWPMMTALCGVASSVFSSLTELGLPQASTVAIHAEGGRAQLACTMACAMGYKVIMIGSDRKSVMPTLSSQDNGGSSSSSLATSPLSSMTSSATFIQMSNKIGQDLMKHWNGVCAVLCLVPGLEHVQELVNGLKPNGKIIMLAPGRDDKLSLNTIPLISDRRSIQGWPASTPIQLEQCFNLVKQHSDSFSKVIKVEKFKLQDAQKSFEMGLDEKSKAKPVICFA